MARPLCDLNPRWIDTDTRKGVAVEIDCPHCAAPITLPLNNPLDGGAPEYAGEQHWTREGDTLELLTLKEPIYRRWHIEGFILSGRLADKNRR